MSTATCCTSRTCFYCDAHLAVSHEHDHMPTPKRHGGEDTVPICLNCHDLKDRMKLDSWPVEAVFSGWAGMTPVGRILLARIYALTLDLQAERALLEQAAA